MSDRESNRARANRINARKSTGPRTEVGRRRASLNRVVHGLRASTAVLPGEDPIEFEALRAGLEAELQPVGAVEAFLVERIGLCIWRLRRAERIERGVLLDQLLGLEVERAACHRQRSERSFLDRLADLETTVADHAAHAEATARLEEVAVLREEELPTLGAVFTRDTAGAGACDAVTRYETTIERGLLRLLRLLRKLQQARGAS